MNKPILNEKTEQAIERLLKDLPQSQIISTIDYQWGEQIAKYLADKLNYEAEIIYPTDINEMIDLDSGILRVKQIRDIMARTRTYQNKNKIYIFYKADSMTEQSQNALLKVFEEPNQSTYFILLVNNQNTLLPTVISRSQQLIIPSLTESQTQQMIPSDIAPTLKSQILFLAKGNPLTIERLLKSPDDIQKYAKNINNAKSLLTANTYEKIIILNKYKDSRQDAIALLDTLVIILKTSIVKGDKKTLTFINAVLDAHSELMANYNIRLTLIHHLT